MSKDIKELCEACKCCWELLSSNNTEIDLMEEVDVDLYEFAAEQHLILVYHALGFPLTSKLWRTCTDNVTQILHHWFNNFGYPTNLRSDGGPQFHLSEFLDFAQETGITLEKSSSYLLQSNGLSETSVKNIKLLHCKCIKSALVEWRSRPSARFHVSPTELFFKFKICGQLPTLCHKEAIYSAAEINRRLQEVKTKREELVADRGTNPSSAEGRLC